MTVTCPPCERPVNDGYLCHRCTAALRETLRAAPAWADQLAMVLGRLTRYTDPSGRRGSEKPLPFNPAATEPARRLDRVLRRACAAVAAPEEVQVARLGLVAAWLVAHVDDIRVLPAAGDWESAISLAVEQAMTVCDRPPEQWYAGPCDQCGRDMYPSVNDAAVACTCGQTWAVAARRAELLHAARDVVAPGPAIARALSTLGTRPVTQDLLRKWRHRGKLEVQRMTTKPATNWYRVGDVLDLLGREAARRNRGGQA